MLAKEYGWAKEEIWENVYLDEAYTYAEIIKERSKAEAKKRIIELKLLLQIIHTDKPKEVLEELDSQMKAIDPTEEPKIPEFDPVGFEALKNAMRNNPRMIIKD